MKVLSQIVIWLLLLGQSHAPGLHTNVSLPVSCITGSTGFVQAADGCGGPIGVCDAGLPFPTTAGNTYLAWTVVATPSTNIITDTQGDTFTQLGNVTDPNTGATSVLWISSVIIGGSSTIFTSHNVPLESDIYIVEVTGAVTVNAVSFTPGFTTGPFPIGPTTTTSTHKYLYSFIGFNAATVGVVPPSGYTLNYSGFGGGVGTNYIASCPSGGAGAYTASWAPTITHTSGVNYVGALVALNHP